MRRVAAFILVAVGAAWAFVEQSGRGQSIFAGFTMGNDRDILARTIWGEARGEGYDGMVAVAAVIMNRVADSRWPNTVAGVCQQPWQFSCWNENDPNRAKLLAVNESDAYFRYALSIAGDAIAGRLVHSVGNANHYFTSSIKEPSWASAMAFNGKVGNHKFFVG